MPAMGGELDGRPTRMAGFGSQGMPVYRFPIHGSYRVDDPDGTELPNDPAAREEALQVIRDLKKNQTELRWNGDGMAGSSR
jgi:hypothetical protein